MIEPVMLKMKSNIHTRVREMKILMGTQFDYLRVLGNVKYFF